MLIFKKIPLIMNDVGAITKLRKNAVQGYAFRGIDDCLNALQTPLAKHGVFFAPNVLKTQREERTTKNGGVMIYTILDVEFNFYAEDGSSFRVVTIGEASDTSDKSANKAMSAALKYAILQLFCIPTEEEKDTEYQTNEVAPKKTAPSTPVKAVAPVASAPVVSSTPPITGVSKENLLKLKELASTWKWESKDVTTMIALKFSKDKASDLSPKEFQELCMIIQTMKADKALDLHQHFTQPASLEKT